MTDYALAFYLVNEQSSHDYEPLSYARKLVTA